MKLSFAPAGVRGPMFLCAALWHVQGVAGEIAWTSRASIPVGRNGHGAAVIGGKVYVVGGYVAGGNRSASVYEYDPGTNFWTVRAPLPSGRAWLAVAAV